MAQNRFSASILKRSEGKNAMARAAYNGRCELSDERTGQKWDFRKRAGLEFEGIFAPENAPKWVRDRQTLWNEVEAKEDRSRHRDTAQLARDFKLSIPHELNKQQREWLVKDFARELSRKGMVVDAVIHRPEKENDARNYHAHLLVTMREIGPNGFGNKVREWNKVEFLQGLRERWSELGAKQLRRAGYRIEAERFEVGHKTLKEQRREAEERGDTRWAKELDREPTKPLGPNAAAMEKRGIATVRGDENREINERNQTAFQQDRRLPTAYEAKRQKRLNERAKERRQRTLTRFDEMALKKSHGERSVIDDRQGKVRIGKPVKGILRGITGVLESLMPEMTPEKIEAAERTRLLREEEAKKRHREIERDR